MKQLRCPKCGHEFGYDNGYYDRNIERLGHEIADLNRQLAQHKLLPFPEQKRRTDWWLRTKKALAEKQEQLGELKAIRKAADQQLNYAHFRFIRMDVCQCFITLVQNVSTMTQSYGEGIIRLLLKTQSGRIKTMAEKMMPYALRMTLAVLANKPDDARSISAECVTAMTKELMGVVSRYDLMDFPFMVAALRLTATSLESLLDEHGKGIADNIVANTTCITIDASELKHQAKEE